jgi:predicted nucleic acid-binding protein
MIDAFVADASISICWVHPSQSTPLTQTLLQEVEGGAMIVVPSLWFLETANALLVLERRKKLTGNERRAALSRINLLDPVVDAGAERRSSSSVSSLASAFQLSIYDALYLDVAKRWNIPLATLDSALQRAAKKSGVKTV